MILPSLKSVNAIFLNAHLKVPSWGCTKGWNPFWTSISFLLFHWVFTNYSSNTYSNYILKVSKIEEIYFINRSKKKYFTLWSSSGRILKVSFQCYHSFSPYTQPYIPSRDDMNGVLKQHQPFQKNIEVLDVLVSKFSDIFNI